jgi:DNA polymerase III alpha subunit
MESLSRHSFNTKLNDRTLWADGASSYSTVQLQNYFLNGSFDLEHVFIDEIDGELKNFIKFSGIDLQVKYKNKDLDTAWNFSDSIKNIEMENIIVQRLTEYINENPKNKEEAIKRVLDELDEFKAKNLLSLIILVHYIVDQFTKNNVVWGVGRGSSCACFIFYLLKLHMVDCITFDIPMSEFFRKE